MTEVEKKAIAWDSLYASVKYQAERRVSSGDELLTITAAVMAGMKRSMDMHMEYAHGKAVIPHE